MNHLFQVAIQYGSVFGSVTYDLNEKKISVHFPIEPVKSKAENYFNHPVTIRRAQGLRNFSDCIVKPWESLGEFKEALGNLYNNTGLRVDWSVINEKIPKSELPV